MKHLLAIIIAMLAVSACTSTSKDEKKVHKTMPGDPEWMEKTRENTKLTKYVDSITAVYPNHEGNLVVQKKISKDFAQKVTSSPGMLEGSTFRIAYIFEEDGKTCVSLICNEAGVNVWCMDYSEDEAAKLDKQKAYEVIGGTIDHFETNDDEIGSQFLHLGDVFVRNLELKEI